MKKTILCSLLALCAQAAVAQAQPPLPGPGTRHFYTAQDLGRLAEANAGFQPGMPTMPSIAPLPAIGSQPARAPAKASPASTRPAAAPAPVSLPQEALALKPVERWTPRPILSGRLEDTPQAELQWGYYSVNRERKLWADKEAQHSKAYDSLAPLGAPVSAHSADMRYAQPWVDKALRAGISLTKVDLEMSRLTLGQFTAWVDRAIQGK